MAKLFNRAKMTTTTTGSGTITLGSASNGFQSFADAGVADGDVVQYVIEEGANFEIGTGTYSATGTSLTRSPTESSNSDSAITLAGQATVSITAVADDLNRLQHNGTDKVTVSSTGASVTGNLAVSGTVDGVDISARDAVLTSTTTTANAALPKAGGTMTGDLILAQGTVTGKLDRHALHIGGNGLGSVDASIYIGNDGDGGGYGWELFYKGSGSSNDNEFILKSENLGSNVDALKVKQDGKSYFANELYASSNQRVFADNYHPNADKWTDARTLSLTGDVTGSVSIDGSANASITTTVSNDSHTHNKLIAVDDRDMKPNTSGIQTSTKAIRAFFSSKGGMTGTADGNYHDVLVLDTYSDSSGGGPNAITFDKGNGAGNPEAYLWKGAWGGTTWGTGQRIFADNYHPNADKWTTSRTLSLTGGVTGSVSWDGSANASLTSTVALATASAVGGIKIGYTENGKNYPVELSDGKAFVNVPWTDTNTNQLTTFVVQDGDSTNVTMGQGKYLKFAEGGAIDVNFTDTSTGSSGDPYDLTISHADTSSQGSVNNSNGTVIQDVTLDTYGHVTGLGSVNLDSRYVNVTGDTMTGALSMGGNLINDAVIGYHSLGATQGANPYPYKYYRITSDLTFDDNRGYEIFIDGDDNHGYAGLYHIWISSHNNSGNLDRVRMTYVSGEKRLVEVVLASDEHVWIRSTQKWGNIRIRALYGSEDVSAMPFATLEAEPSNAQFTEIEDFEWSGDDNTKTVEKNWHSNNDGSGSGLNADLLDGVQGSSFLRSDADDTVNAGVTYTWSNTDTHGLQFTNSSYGTQLRIGGWTTSNNDNISRIRNSSGNLHIDSAANGNLYFNWYSGGSIQCGSQLDMNNNDIVGVDQIVHEGDTDTYMQFHGADSWRVVTGGTERLEATNSGIRIDDAFTLPTTDGSANQVLTTNGSGQVSWTTQIDTNTNTNQLTTFQLEDGDGTEVTIGHGKEVKFVEGGGIDINWTDTSHGSDGDPYDLTFTHADTSSQASVNNSNGTVIQDVTLDGYGHVTGLASVNLDGRYYTESEINTFINRSYVSKHSATNLATGWYTIAQNTGDRAVARFALWDTNSSDHQAVIFYASHHFGTDASNTLTVLDNSYFSGNPFRYIRIKDAGTYDGAALQVYIDDASNSVNIAIVGDDVQSSGWDIVDFLGDATAPSQVSNWSNFGERSKIDLNQIAQGGLATTGPIYADGDTTQYRVFNDNYHPNADKWTTARTLSLTGEVTGSVSWDGSANASISATLTESPNFSTSLTVDGHTLQDSADRSGLLELTTSLGSWRGIQIKPTSTSLWSIMGDQDDFGLYDDYNGEWIMLYNENSTLQLYGNGSNQLSVGSSYVEVADRIRHMGDTNTYMQFHAADQWRVVVGGTERLEVKNSSPHVLVTGDLNSTSDARLKENVEPIANALSDITQLEGVSFDWKDTGTRGHGFIAQQVEPILPDVVQTDDETGIKSINYVGMIGHLVEAIKEQQTQIDALTAQVEELKRQ